MEKELKPRGRFVLVTPISNPFRRKIESDLLLATPEELNEINESTAKLEGKVNELEQSIYTCVVLEVGSLCNEIKVKDIVYCIKDSLIPIPFSSGENLIHYVIDENQVLSFVRDVFDEVK